MHDHVHPADHSPVHSAIHSAPGTNAYGTGTGERDGQRRRLGWVFALASLYAGVEVTGGLVTGSLALLADAFHLLSDVAALGLSFFAIWIAQQPSGARRTFGHSRAEILAALANGVGLAVMAVMVMMQAVERLGAPTEVNGLGVVVIASGALLYEGVGLWILHAGSRDNLNVRGAFLHVASDALGSLGAIAAGLCVWAFGWRWADPVASLLISVLVLFSAWRLLREAVDVLMETAPRHLDVDQIRSSLAELAGAVGVHDLHVWTIGSGEVSLSCHVVSDGTHEAPAMLRAVHALLADRFGVHHSTVQIEMPDAGTRDPAEAGAGGLACEERACDAPAPPLRAAIGR
jgi:cobalt-zinc-cadmium efflux system protein